jgi:hypothetical protein
MTDPAGGTGSCQLTRGVLLAFAARRDNLSTPLTAGRDDGPSAG